MAVVVIVLFLVLSVSLCILTDDGLLAAVFLSLCFLSFFAGMLIGY